jgi:DNA-binding MarR family transcriptional regulator
MQGKTNTEVSAEQLAEELLELWGCMMRSSQTVYSVFEELDISLTQIKTMHALDGWDENPSVKQLSDQLGLSLAGTSRTAEALLQRGWVVRTEDDQDRRVKRLALTDAGRTVLRRIDAARLEGTRDYTATLTPDQRARFSALVAELPHRSA